MSKDNKYYYCNKRMNDDHWLIIIKGTNFEKIIKRDCESSADPYAYVAGYLQGLSYLKPYIDISSFDISISLESNDGRFSECMPNYNHTIIN